MRGQGDSFQFVTIYQEVVGRHQVYACFKSATQIHISITTVILVPVHRALSALEAVKGLVIFWVTELKRTPLSPSAVGPGVYSKQCELLLRDDSRIDGLFFSRVI